MLSNILINLAKKHNIETYTDDCSTWFRLADVLTIAGIKTRVYRFATSVRNIDKKQVNNPTPIWYVSPQCATRIIENSESDEDRKFEYIMDFSSITSDTVDTREVVKAEANLPAIFAADPDQPPSTPEYKELISNYRIVPYNDKLAKTIGSITGMPIGIYESPLTFHMRSLIPFMPVHQILQVFSSCGSYEKLCWKYFWQRRHLLNCPPDLSSDLDRELRDQLVWFELQNEFPTFSFTTFKGQEQRIVFLNKNNFRTYGRNHVGDFDRLDMYLEYIEENYYKFSENLLVPAIDYNKPRYYYGKPSRYDVHFHENIRVPYNRLSEELQRMYDGPLDFQVSPEDAPLCNICEWYMKLENGRIIVYRKSRDSHSIAGEQRVQYYIMQRLLQMFPEEVFVITPMLYDTTFCRDFLAISRLQTQNPNTMRDISETEIRNRFRKMNTLSFDALVEEYNRNTVVNACGEFVPKDRQRGLWKLLKFGNDWISPDRFEEAGIREQHNLMPNNHVKPAIVVPQFPTEGLVSNQTVLLDTPVKRLNYHTGMQ